MCYAVCMDIKEIRKQLGMTSQDLAVALGVSVATVSRWETGKHKPSKLALLRLKELIDKMKI